MIRWLQILAVLLGIAVLAATGWLFVPHLSTPPASEAWKSKLPDYDYKPWHALPVQSGRIKPFQSFAGESVRQITGRTKFEGHDPVAVVLAWWLTDGRGAGGEYTDWEHYPFILCDHHALRRTTFAHLPEMDEEQAKGKRITPADLRASPGFDRLISEVAKARQELEAKAHRRLSAEHLKAEEVGRRLVLFDQLCGKATTRLHTNALCAEQFIDLKELAAVEGKTPEGALVEFEKKLKKHPDPLHIANLDWASRGEWLSLGELRLIRDPQYGPAYLWRRLLGANRLPADSLDSLRDDIRRITDSFVSVRRAYRDPSDTDFNGSTQEFRRELQNVTTEPNRVYIDHLKLELGYNGIQPFLWAWVLMLLATVVLSIALVSSSKPVYVIGMGCYALSAVVQFLGFAARIAISGFAPVTNMYESLIFVAFIAGLLALVLELIYRKKVIALAGAAVSTLGLILADQLPLALDPKISPVVPVLRTNYWLTIHVLTIVCGYGAGTLAWGLGNVSLAMLAFGKGSDETLKMLGRFTYRAMQLTVVLVAAGTFLGGWWAAEAWGRFWGWDPKEVGALIALVAYVIPLHARYIGWVREFGLAVSAVLCYAAILLSWYVVNFVLAAGLHSYGFGGGGGEWVLWAGLVNLEWVVIAGLFYLRKRQAKQTLADPGEPGA